MTCTHILGFPRIGARRELKFALEKHWRGEIDASALEATGADLRARHWQAQRAAGLDFVTVGDFAYYDHVANHIQLLGCEPARLGFEAGAAELSRYFTMARGVARAAELPLAGQGKAGRPGPVHAARSAAARVWAGAGPSEGAGRGLGADGRAGAGPGSARCLAPCVRARLLATGPQRTPVDAGNLLFAACRKPAHGVPIARRRTACRCGARPGGTTGRRRLAAGAQSAVRRHRRWPQHLAQRPGRGARAPADGARQTPGRTLDCAVVLAAACAIEPGRRA